MRQRLKKHDSNSLPTLVEKSNENNSRDNNSYDKSIEDSSHIDNTNNFKPISKIFKLIT